MAKLIQGLKGFMLFGLGFNILFATLFCILEADIGSQYDGVSAPVKWMTFAFRNALHDFSISSDNGFYPEGFEWDQTLENAVRVHMYLTWAVWYGNVFLMTIVLGNFLIAAVCQSYEQISHDLGAHRYR